MTSRRKTYTLEPQRLVVGSGYVPCEPHQAARIAILEVTSYTRQGKRYRVTRNQSTFYGPQMLARASAELARLTHRSNGRSEEGKRGRSIWGQSLTRLEYDQAVANGLTKPEVKWRRQPPSWHGSKDGRSE
jgi:hypothetical protein